MDIAIFHPDLSSRGGGENVCLHVLESLQNIHNLTLYTMIEPDFKSLNQYFDTNVNQSLVRVDSLAVRGRAMRSLSNLVQRYTERTFMRLQSAFLNRTVDRRDHNLVISTYNEFSFDSPALQYIHYPNFAGESDGRIHPYYERICRKIDGFDRDKIRRSVLLANSEWTADVVEDIYGDRPRVVYPPVNTKQLDGSPWGERESGFVCAGRIEPSKRILEIIEIIEALQQRGHDVHLHVVGPTDNDRYRTAVESRAAESEFVQLEGEVDRQRLVELLCTHRFGIHGKIDEHFGIIVAEMLAAGALPLVPNSGGQREIVGGHDDLLYDSLGDAVNLADRLIGDRDLQRLVRSELPDATAKFGQDVFKKRIRRLVDDRISGSKPGEGQA